MTSRIQQEIKQSRPFKSRSQEAAIALMRTADLVRRSVGGIVEPFDLTPQQYNVLRILRGAGEEGLPTLEIAERMIEQTPGITRLIDRLETKHLVSRERCKTDRRRVWCRITRDGLGLLEPARQTDPRRGRLGAGQPDLARARSTDRPSRQSTQRFERGSHIAARG